MISDWTERKHGQLATVNAVFGFNPIISPEGCINASGVVLVSISEAVSPFNILCMHPRVSRVQASIRDTGAVLVMAAVVVTVVAGGVAAPLVAAAIGALTIGRVTRTNVLGKSQ